MPTVEEVDQAIAKLGSRTRVLEEEIPEFLEYRGKGIPIITEEVHEGIIGRWSGTVRRFAPSGPILDLLLDLRNELEQPVHEITEV